MRGSCFKSSLQTVGETLIAINKAGCGGNVNRRITVQTIPEVKVRPYWKNT
jgi:hypothetical protein